jgi:hypothetical protein
MAGKEASDMGKGEGGNWMGGVTLDWWGHSGE